MTWHRFGSPEMDDADEDAGSYFISAVCWKSDCPTMLSANSQGTIKVLVLAAWKNYKNKKKWKQYKHRKNLCWNCLFYCYGDSSHCFVDVNWSLKLGSSFFFFFNLTNFLGVLQFWRLWIKENYLKGNYYTTSFLRIKTAIGWCSGP